MLLFTLAPNFAQKEQILSPGQEERFEKEREIANQTLAALNEARQGIHNYSYFQALRALNSLEVQLYNLRWPTIS